MNLFAPRFLLPFILVSSAAFSTDAPKLQPDACDDEWNRIKSLPPMKKAMFDLTLGSLDNDRRGISPRPLYQRVDALYLLARTPFIIDADHKPTLQERYGWLTEAAAAGHKAAKATLMQQKYLGPLLPSQSRASREEYLVAARDAAEAGDPDFATVMMDTARNTNRIFHCRESDSQIGSNGCVSQSVTKPEETRYWAETAARGGNPAAKDLLCKLHYFGTYPQWGFNKNEQLAFQWCFAAAHSACSAAGAGLLLSSMYEKGAGVEKNATLSSFWAEFSRRNRDLFWPIKSK